MAAARTTDPRPGRAALAYWILTGLLSAFALWLAVTRIYQVDEAQNLFMSRVLATDRTDTYFSNALLWMLGPLSWLGRSAPDAASLFLEARLIFLGVFFLNIVLLALATGVRLGSKSGKLALLGAATLVPLWDYGFEIRHDNLILTGLLLMWWLGRVRPRGGLSFAAIGFLTVVMVFMAFKAFAYVVPLSGALLLFPPPGHDRSRLRLLAAWVAGAAAGALLALLAYQVSGQWSVFAASFHSGASAMAADAGSRFGPGIALSRLPTQTPLLLALAAGALIALGLALRREGWKALDWAGTAPETLLVLGALGVLWINPTPFPYNLVNLVPFLYLLAFRFAAPLAEGLAARPGYLPLALGVVIFTHTVPFVSATWRHLDWTNDRQVLLMRTAEAMTDPAQDPVYDAVGMVPTRESIGYFWYLHSLNMPSVLNGKTPSVSQMLTANPAPVLIRNYRTDWLPTSDHRFIASRYIPLADDFWVLGQILPEGGGTYQVVHPGRYQVFALKADELAALPAGTLDGEPLGAGPVTLDMGQRQIQCPADCQPVVAWLGPRLPRVPNLGAGDHRRLFVNWY